MIRRTPRVTCTYTLFPYTSLCRSTNPTSGTLARDGAARTLKTSLAALTLTPLTSGGAAGVPTTLAEIGVTTNRDGTLSVDSDRLSRALTAPPGAIEAMFAQARAATGDGLPAALDALAAAAADQKDRTEENRDGTEEGRGER